MKFTGGRVGRRATSVLTVAVAMAAPASAAPDGSAVVKGRVIDVGGHGVASVSVTVQGPRLPAPRTTTSGAEGEFRFEALPAPATYQVSATRGDQQKGVRRVSLEPGVTKTVELSTGPSFIEEVTVTATRSEQLRVETPATVDIVSREALDASKPGHPGEILGRVPGVWVSVTGGEGHMTAIRQPLTTSPVYLYLEDGVPTRSTGFFNHNALYEINVPAAEAVEVTKGPGSALYGSDAIGGVVNATSAAAPPTIRSRAATSTASA